MQCAIFFASDGVVWLDRKKTKAWYSYRTITPPLPLYDHNCHDQFHFYRHGRHRHCHHHAIATDIAISPSPSPSPFPPCHWSYLRFRSCWCLRRLFAAIGPSQSSPYLVQLTEPEHFRVFYHAHTGSRNVHANLNPPQKSVGHQVKLRRTSVFLWCWKHTQKSRAKIRTLKKKSSCQKRRGFTVCYHAGCVTRISSASLLALCPFVLISIHPWCLGVLL